MRNRAHVGSMLGPCGHHLATLFDHLFDAGKKSKTIKKGRMVRMVGMMRGVRGPLIRGKASV